MVNLRQPLNSQQSYMMLFYKRSIGINEPSKLRISNYYDKMVFKQNWLKNGHNVFSVINCTIKAWLFAKIFKSNFPKSVTIGLSLNFDVNWIDDFVGNLEGSNYLNIDHYFYFFIMTILSRSCYLYLHYQISQKFQKIQKYLPYTFIIITK